MKSLFRAVSALVAVCFALLLASFTTVVVKKVFLHGDGVGKAHVAVLDLNGIILGADSTLRDLKKLLKDHSVKALVVRINSPGGLVAPSQEIYEALKRADQKIPVLISMQSLAASGGYYAALGGRKIYADPGTFTASIGVIMEFVNSQKLYEWAKVDRFDLKAGKFKDAGSSYRPMTTEEKELFQTILNDVAVQFKRTVKERRKITDAELDQFADGRVMTGQQAYSAKLIDALGGFEDVVAEAKKIAQLPESAEVVFPESKGGLLRQLLLGEESESSYPGPLQTLSQQLLPGFSPGWRVVLLSPLR